MAAVLNPIGQVTAALVALAGYPIYTSDAASQTTGWLGEQLNGLNKRHSRRGRASPTLSPLAIPAFLPRIGVINDVNMIDGGVFLRRKIPDHVKQAEYMLRAIR